MKVEAVASMLLVSPPPNFGHQDAVLNLAVRLRDACPSDLRVLIGPFAINVGRDFELQPDLLVARYCDLITDGLTDVPLLVAEVRSPGTGQIDRTLKRFLYADHGVPSYWLVDPETPALTAYKLAASRQYELVGEVEGADSWRATEPFPVSITPNDLVAGLELLGR
jgi:Uma2 family endonuclease